MATADRERLTDGERRAKFEVCEILRFIADRLHEDERTARSLVEQGIDDWCQASSHITMLRSTTPQEPPPPPRDRAEALRRVKEMDRLFIHTEFNVANRHIERHDPARVLRAVGAKRRIVEIVKEFARPDYSTDGECIAWRVLLGLASEWSDHEDYRPEWAL